MKTLKLHPLLPALLLVLAPLAVGCGREEPREDEQVSIEEPRERNTAADESYDIGANERIGEEPRDPELPQRQVVVVEPEEGPDAGIDEELSARESELARREAELAERERRLKRSPEPQERIARQEPKPEPKARPVPPVAKPKPKPEPEERPQIARKPEPKPAPPAVTKPKPQPKPEERVARKPEPKPKPAEPTEKIAAKKPARDDNSGWVGRPDREPAREEDNSGWVGRPAERERETEERQPSSVTVPAGTVVEVEILEDLSSQTSKVGRHLPSPRGLEREGGRPVAIPAGSEVVGEVTEAVPLRKVGGRAKLGVKFTDLVLPSGATVPIDA